MLLCLDIRRNGQSSRSPLAKKSTRTQNNKALVDLKLTFRHVDFL
jgi:hypothetical protein